MALLVNAAWGATALAEPVRILALGDSLTAGYNLAAQEAFPAQLEKALRDAGYDVAVINAGVSGDTSAGGLARLDWVLSESSPDLAIVELGANDGLRGLDPAHTGANLTAIIERLRRDGVRILLAGMKAPPNLGAEYAAEFEAVYAELAGRPGVALYPFFLDGVAANPGLNQKDGIHPTARGIEVIVERILPYVTRMLDAADGVRSSQ
ncbi:MAG: arylesterase [Rhodospirillales bacterium]|nr:arylesterase [Rhodospirillales bacterium]